MIAVELPPDTEAKLVEAARARGIPLPVFVENAIIEMIADLDDVAEAEQALDDIASGRSGMSPLAEVEHALGLGDRDR